MDTDAELRTRVRHLEAALITRDLIGQAKGMLMERHGIGPDEAFDRLVAISQTTNTKLADVAAMVTGAMDADGQSEAVAEA